MTPLQSFKSEFRLISNNADCHSDAVEALFECLGQMSKRGLPIPEKYQYRPCVGDPTEEDSYFHSIFELELNNGLNEIAEFLFRYINIMELKIPEMKGL